MLSDPLEGITWESLERGDKFESSRLGEVEFYMYRRRYHRLEVFDKYGVLRYIPVEEYYYDRAREDSGQIKSKAALQELPIPISGERWLGRLRSGRSRG